MKAKLTLFVRDYRDTAVELIGYAGVSVVALAVDFSIYWWMLGASLNAYVPAAVGYAAGAVVHYVLASRLVFARPGGRRGIAHEAPVFAKYLATGLAGLVLTAAIVGICADVLGWSALLAKAIAMVFAFAVVFLARKYLVFGMPAGSPVVTG